MNVSILAGANIINYAYSLLYKQPVHLAHARLSLCYMVTLHN